MLRPYTPDTNTIYSADPRSVRVCAPSFARTGTLAVDNNPASKGPKSGGGGLFPEVGAEHLNSSRRSCVTCFSRRFRTRFLSPTAAEPRRQWRIVPFTFGKQSNQPHNHLAKGRKAKADRNAPAARSGAAGYEWQLKIHSL